MENVTFNQAAKDIFTAQSENIKSALDLAINAKDKVNSAAQIIALTSYQAFETNGATIPAANIGAFLGLSENETKKMKQYVSRASYVWGYKGKPYTDDGQNVTTPHEDFMTDNAPSITSTYKAIKAHEKALKQAAEQETQRRAMELKAAQAYVDSGADMPEGVTNADELLAKARASAELGLENDFTAALSVGMEVVEAENSAAVEQDTCANMVTQAQAIIDALNERETETADDAIITIHAYIEALAESRNQSQESEAKAA